jgi:serine/threonine protein kinase
LLWALIFILQIGTLNYMSPKTMNAAPGDDRLKIGRPSDVWSPGCILYQMVYGAAPFAALGFQQKIIAIAREDHIIAFPEYAVPILPKEKSSTGKAEWYPKHQSDPAGLGRSATLLRRRASLTAAVIRTLD